MPETHRCVRSLALALIVAGLTAHCIAADDTPPGTHGYENRLTPLRDPKPLLADWPEFVAPIVETRRFEAPPLIDDEEADLSVRGWRFSYNARGIIEIPNRLRGRETAVIVVHPWGIDDGQGWNTPGPNGVAFQCTPEKNQLARKHMRAVINPFLKTLRPSAKVLACSLPGTEDPIRRKLYRSVRATTTADERAAGQRALEAKLQGFDYVGKPIPATLTLSKETPLIDYFRQFPGLDAGPAYNNAGFWDLPIPVAKDLDVALDDVVFYDAEGYTILKKFLKEQGVRHIILLGYNTDMCVCKTTAGYENLRRDFNVFLVGDATLATFPANPTPALATTAAVSFASLDLCITQTTWVKPLKPSTAGK